MRSRTGAKSMALFAMALLATVAMSSCSGPKLPSYEAIPASEGRIVHHARGEKSCLGTPNESCCWGR